MEIKKGIYKHFKGHFYKVIGLAKHSETLQVFVVYANVDNENDTWIRPIDMFFENVFVDGILYPRFEFIKEA